MQKGIQVKVGQVWKEVDKRFERYVNVIGIDEQNGIVTIKTSKKTKANIKRFNGKSGGYEFVRES